MRRDEKILVVEDNPIICQDLELRFNCDCATDGWDAIGKLETTDYAVIVIDADVPHHSGYGVLAYLREEIGEEMGNVIFMTSSDCEIVRRNYGQQLNVVEKSGAADAVTRVLGVVVEPSKGTFITETQLNTER
jgi:DNA-binding response OmpR family regulator